MEMDLTVFHKEIVEKIFNLVDVSFFHLSDAINSWRFCKLVDSSVS
jgi:hypothetical protein